MSPTAFTRPIGLWSGVAHVCGRLLWLVLLMAHLPAVMVLLTVEPGDPIRLVALLLSQAFFVLKVADVRFLRLPKSLRMRAALLICVALLHADVVQRYAAAGYWPDVQPVTWVVLGSLPVVVAIRSGLLHRRLRAIGVLLLRRWQLAWQTYHGWLASVAYLIHRPALVRISLSHRAPPFAARL